MARNKAVSLSTMEDEFVAASEIANKLLGMREMLSEIGMAPGMPMLTHVPGGNPTDRGRRVVT